MNKNIKYCIYCGCESSNLNHKKLCDDCYEDLLFNSNFMDLECTFSIKDKKCRV